jgi:hypothetical protein
MASGTLADLKKGLKKEPPGSSQASQHPEGASEDE